MIRIGLHATAALYTGGTIAQLLKLIYNFSWQEMPYFIDWVIVILGTLGATTLAIQTRRIQYRGWWEKPVHFLIIAHLGISVAIHLWAIYIRSHDVFAAFPFEYSYFALVYFAFFAWRSWTLTLSNGSAKNDA